MTDILMDIIIIAFLIIFMWQAKPIADPLSNFNLDYLTLKSGKPLRGIFAITVLLCHLAQRTSEGGIFPLNEHMGFLAVAVFYFLSGYGLQKQYLRREDYANNFLARRLLPIVVPYFLLTIVYWLMFASIDIPLTIGDVIILFVLYGEPIAWYSWYIVSILTFYIAFWLLMRLCKRHYLLMIVVNAILFVVHVILCKAMNWGIWWYCSTHLLTIGMLWATYEERIISAIKKNYWIILSLATALLIPLFCAELTYEPSLDVRMCLTLIFVFIVLLVTLKVKIGNPILNYLGEISLEIYLCQGLFLLPLSSDALDIQNDFLYSILVIAGTVISAHLVHQSNKWLFKKLEARKHSMRLTH